MESILETIKQLILGDKTAEGFDTDLIVDINYAFMRLNQLGVGPIKTFLITGAIEKWSDFLGADTDLEGVKTYVHLKTKLLFDPPATSFGIEALQGMISELEFTLPAQKEGVLADGQQSINY